MILFLLVNFALFHLSVSQSSCPNNTTYGAFCNITCSHCFYGCDMSGSCLNSVCTPAYYGNICNNSSPIPNSPFITSLISSNVAATPCTGVIWVLKSNLTSNQNSLNYFLLYGTDALLNNNDPTINTSSQSPMVFNSNTNRYEATIQFSAQAYHRFGVYITFEDLYLYGTFNSLVSPIYRVFIYMSNCSISTNVTIPLTTTSSPTTTTTTSSTVSSTVSGTFSNSITSTIPSTSSSTISTTMSSTSFTTSSNITFQYSSTVVSTLSSATSRKKIKKHASTSGVPTTISPVLTVTNLNVISNFTTISVSWVLPVNTNGLQNFGLSISPSSQTAIVNPSTTSYLFSNLSSGTQYTITVTSVYISGSYPKTITASTLSTSAPYNLIWTKSYTYGIISWSPPLSPGYTGFKISTNNSMMTNPTLLNPTVNSYNVTSLVPANAYLIIISAVYGAMEPQVSMTVWTKPAPFTGLLGLPIISSITNTNFQVQFPATPSYPGIINLYYIAIQVNSTSSRKKRDALSCNTIIPGIIPTGALIVYANNTNLNVQNILIGSGNSIPPLNCPNSPLTANTKYNVIAVIGSLLDNTAEYTSSSATFQTSASALTAGMIAGIIIGILLLLLLILLLIFCLRYRKKKENFGGIKGPYEDIKPFTYKYWSDIGDRMHARKIILDQNHIPEGLNFKDEYDNLPQNCCEDHLGNDMTMSTNEYHKMDSLNTSANFIDGYIKKKAFISTQNPIDKNAIADFWNCIYVENVGQIVMITISGEYIKQKTYWTNKQAVYGLIEVSLIEEDQYAYFEIRTFEIRKIDSKEKLKVTQYHYRSWPDNDLINIPSFLEFHQIIKREESLIYGPVVVLSQPGCPLNTVYIGFDILNDQLNQENEVNVFRTIGQLRRFRLNTMININQYMIFYDLLFESYLCSRHVVDTNIKSLLNSSSEKYWKFLQKQIQLIREFYPTALRYGSHQEQSHIFDSIEFQKSIFLQPLPVNFVEEIVNFWMMVFQNNISTIVDFKNRTTDEMFYIPQTLFNFKISIKNVTKCKKNVMKQEISISKLGTNETRKITIYSVNSKNTLTYNIDECSTWIELISMIMKDNRYNLLIFRVEGSFLSTVFLACLNASSKLHHSHFVSVYYIIKSLQSSGHPIIETNEQFCFVFEFLSMWIEKNINSSNQKIPFNIMDTIDLEDSFIRGPYKRLYSDYDNKAPYSNNSSFNKLKSSKYQSNDYDSDE